MLKPIFLRLVTGILLTGSIISGVFNTISVHADFENYSDIKGYEAIVTASSLTVRENPCGKAVGSVSENQRVTIQSNERKQGNCNGYNGKWGYVSTPRGQTGWVALGWIRELTASDVAVRDVTPVPKQAQPAIQNRDVSKPVSITDKPVSFYQRPRCDIIPLGKWCTRYYNEHTMKNVVLERIEDVGNEYQMQRNFGSGSPAPQVNSDYFAASSVGQFFFPVVGEYIFEVDSDDAFGIGVENTWACNQWQAQSVKTTCSVWINKVGWNTVTINWYDMTGEAHLKVRWPIASSEANGNAVERYNCIYGYIEKAEWVYKEIYTGIKDWSLAVTPTLCGRVMARPTTWSSWQELFDKTPNQGYDISTGKEFYWDKKYGTDFYWSVYKQYICHADFASVLGKDVYHLDTWRENLSYKDFVTSGCNP